MGGTANPAQWLMFGGDYSAKRHSPLTQITPQNVNRLVHQWTFQNGAQNQFETTPLVYDGVLYVTGLNNTAWALDARTGRPFWRYRRQLPEDLRVCCGPVNRGFGVLAHRLFMTTLDAHLAALDSRTGDVLWDVELDDYKKGYAVHARAARRQEQGNRRRRRRRVPARRGSSPPTIPRPAAGCGASAPCPRRVRRAARRGKPTPPSAAAPASG